MQCGGGRGVRSEARQFVWVDRCCLHVERNVQPDRTIAPVLHLKQGALKVIPNLLRIIDRYGVFSDCLHHRHDVDFLHAALAQRAAGKAVRAFDLA